MKVDESWLLQTLVEIVQLPTQVPSGETEIPVGDARIAAAVRRLLDGRLRELRPDEARDHPDGDVALRFGPDGEAGLLIQTYVVSQHANLMDDSKSGRIVDGERLGLRGQAVLGQGVTQGKGPMAAALAAVRATRTELRRPLWLAVNTEGRSSHGGSARILDDLGVRAAYGLIAFGTDLRISLGNRGRVDVEIRVRGTESHSSQPWLGDNPIEGAVDVVDRLRTLPLPDPHPILGPGSATPYLFECSPIAPHTIPSESRVIVDRRLLPGEDPDVAVEAMRLHLAQIGSDVEVRKAAWMLPAQVSPQSKIVRSLSEAIEAVTGLPAEAVWSPNAFDAGYACSKGIPTPMYGPGKRRFSGAGLTGTDAVSIEDCRIAAAVIADCIRRLCCRDDPPTPS